MCKFFVKFLIQYFELFQTIEIEFLAFDIEGSGGCVYDSVTLYDGSTDTSPLLGTLCGNVLPAVIASTQNFIMIQIATDHVFVYNGFLLEWRIIGMIYKFIFKQIIL